MCGFAGIVSQGHSAFDAAKISTLLSHRGPDDSGFWSTAAGDYQVAFIHRRLRIVDLSPAGRQPMIRGDLSIVFNGEIYNFRELRQELTRAGVTFVSSGDTEVILAVFARWGIEGIQRLDGMFALALWDSRSRELVLARDRLGKKPLFYHHTGKSILFGSEIKAILASLAQSPAIDREALDSYLTYLYVPYPKTIFSGVLQLPPATWMRIRVGSHGLRTESCEYWSPLVSRSTRKRSTADTVEELRTLLAASVKSRLIADVPLGVLLSGGMDSSTITAMMARSGFGRVRSFSIGFPGIKAYDEIPFASRLAARFDSEHKVLKAEASCARHLAKIVWHFDQPFGNPTAVLMYMLSKLTREHVTVALAGDGGDELFGGYPRYAGAYLSGIPRALPAFIRHKILPAIGGWISDDSNGRHQFRRLREFLEDGGLPLIEMYLRWVGYFSEREKEALYINGSGMRQNGDNTGEFLRSHYRAAEGLDPLDRLAYVDLKSFLCCNVLEYGDRMSMAHALELRAPFTDHKLVEFALQMPFSLKFRHGQQKWVLKRAMKPILPREVLRKRKLGLNPPLGAWLNSELQRLPNALLSEQALRKRGLFRPEAVKHLLETHASGRRDRSLHIWALVVLEIWFRMYVDGRTIESVQDEIDQIIDSSDRTYLSKSCLSAKQTCAN
jgi:asparagine synthase (glutamine-hydrolysing)